MFKIKKYGYWNVYLGKYHCSSPSLVKAVGVVIHLGLTDLRKWVFK